jgi:dipeptidyl aminopeptidase/acylaminoacyl peptidase
MKPIPSLVLLLACAAPLAWAADAPVRSERGALVFEDVAEPTAARADAFGPYSEVRTARFGGWLPGGGMAVLTRFAETNQVHVVDAPGAARRQLTFHREPVARVAVRPGVEAPGIVHARDVGGNEQFQLYWMDLAESTGATRITDGKSRNTQPVWAADGSVLAWASTARNGVDADLWLWSPGGEARRVTAEAGSWSPLDVSAGGASLLAALTRSINDVVLYRVDGASGAVEKLVDAGGVSTYDTRYPAALRDGRLLYASSVGGEFATLRLRDLDTGRERPFGPRVDWDVEELAFAPAGDRVAVLYNEDGSSVVRVLAWPGGDVLSTHAVAFGVAADLAFSADGMRLAWSESSARMPGDVIALDLATGTTTRWTESELGGLPPDRFVAPRLVRYPSFDRVRGKPRGIPAYVFTPAGDGPHPVLVDIHGGPESQSRSSFSAWRQYLVNELGIAVVVPNVRGSSGYGRSWLDADNGRKRLDSVRDIGALLDWIDAEPGLDGKRVVVYGGSYGGYMVLASLVEYGERLAGGVSIVGISHFRTFLENTSPYRVDLRRVEYGDERDPAMRAWMDRTAPLANAARIKSPLFVIHGANDPRVPASEAEQILAAVRANGADAWYLLARDEGHGFRKKGNRDAMQRAVVAFLERHVLAGEP